MTKRVLSILLAILIIGGMTPGVLASAEPETAISAAEEALSGENTEAAAAPAEDAEAAAEEEEAVVIVEASSEDFAETPLTYTLPGGEEIAVDPEDPLYERYMGDGQTLLSAWNEIETYKNFTPRTVEGEVVRPGIDVSSWQGTINWEKVAAAGVEFVFVRGAYRGTSVGALGEDVQFEKNVKGALAAGLKVGAYIYSQAITEEEAVEEAEFLMDVVAGWDIQLPLVIDYEYYGYGGRLYNAKLTDRQRTDICLAFCERMEAAGYESMVYANASMLKDDMYASELDKVWLAHFTKKTGYSGEYEYWQCSASGSVDGIAGDVDLDFWFDKTGPFGDVKEGDWFYDTVLEAYEKGIVSGMGDGVFAPYDHASRGQVVTMLHRLMGLPGADEEAGFTDLTADYYIPAVNWAAENGIVKGYSETKFGPDGLITRQDLVTILYRMAGSPAVDSDLSAYGDGADVRDYARSAMAWAVKNGVLHGYEDNTLRPGAEASRAEVCAILMRYMSGE